ncbi:MAG TPA: DUF4350 domain-containing protein [Candidatus Thermoplasmatota archaeon]|nr:DUF4350 domain-containing protein [Candidatus Thermoplasmatota archaeon]
MALSRGTLGGLVVAAAVVVLLAAASIPHFSADPAYGATDDAPAGLSRLVALAESEVGSRGGGVTVRTLASGPLALEMIPDAEAPRALYVAVGVEREPSAQEAEALAAFVQRGGRILVADDVGHGGVLAAPFGVQFTRQRLYDERSRDGDASFVEADLRVDQAFSPVLLNVPTALFVDRNATTSCARVLGESSARSYVDTNGDGQVDDRDQKGPFTVALGLMPGRADCAGDGPLQCPATGPGCAFFLADSGLLLNGILATNLSTEYRNDEFTVALLRKALPEGGVLLVDESLHGHGAAAPAVGVMGALVKGSRDPLFLLLLAGLVAAAGGLAAWRLGRAPDWRHVHRPDTPTNVTREALKTPAAKQEDESP